MINVAIVGLGFWGLRLLQAISGHCQTIRVVAVVTKREVGSEVLQRHKGLEIFPDFNEAVKSSTIDAVVLTSRHSDHYRQILIAAENGKSVFCEKPFTLTTKEALDAIKLLTVKKICWTVGFNRRFAPAFLELKSLIKQGLIGTVTHAEAHHTAPLGFDLVRGHWRSLEREAPAGGMTSRGLHTLDALIDVVGEISEICSFSEKRVLSPPIEVDDVTSFLIRFKSGVTGVFSTLITTASSWHLRIFGTQGWIEMRDEITLSIKKIQDKDPTQITLKPVDKEALELDNFATGILENRCALIDPKKIFNGIAALEAIKESSDKRRWVKLASFPSALKT